MYLEYFLLLQVKNILEKIKTKKYRFTLKIIMLYMRIIPLVIFTPYRIYYQEITVYKKLDIVKQYMF